MSSKWSVDQETLLFKSICRLKPTGPHKHFRMIGIRSTVNSKKAPKDKNITAGQIWEKLGSLYELPSLDESDNTTLTLQPENLEEEDNEAEDRSSLHNSDDKKDSEEKFEEFVLPWLEYWPIMEIQAQEKDKDKETEKEKEKDKYETREGPKDRKDRKDRKSSVRKVPTDTESGDENAEDAAAKSDGTEDVAKEQEYESLEDDKESSATPAPVGSRKRPRNDDDTKSESEAEMPATRKTRRSTRFTASTGAGATTTPVVVPQPAATPKTKGKAQTDQTQGEDEPSVESEKSEKEDLEAPTGSRTTRRQTLTRSSQSTRRSSRRK